jgi:hypothetical protein
MLDSLRELIPDINKLTNIPQIGIFGSESRGKSYLLNRMCLLPLVPQGQNRVTTLKTVIRMRRGQRRNPTIVITNDGLPDNPPIPVSMYNCSSTAQTEMLRLCPTRNLRKDCTLEIHLSGPDYPDLDLHDFAGSSTFDKQATVANEMMEDFVRLNGDRATYVYVEKAPDRDGGNIGMLKGANQALPDVSRSTLGIFTFADMVDRHSIGPVLELSTSAGPAAAASEEYALVEGYVVTSLRSEPDDLYLPPLVAVETVARRENASLHEAGFDALRDDHRGGVNHAVDRIHGMVFRNHLGRDFLPSRFKLIEEKLSALVNRDADLGKPHTPFGLSSLSAEDRAIFIPNFASKVQERLQDSSAAILAKFESKSLRKLRVCIAKHLPTRTLSRVEVDHEISVAKSSIQRLCFNFLHDRASETVPSSTKALDWTRGVLKVLSNDDSEMKISRYPKEVNLILAAMVQNQLDSYKAVEADIEAFLFDQFECWRSVSLVTVLPAQPNLGAGGEEEESDQEDLEDDFLAPIPAESQPMVTLSFNVEYLAETISHILARKVAQLFQSSRTDVLTKAVENSDFVESCRLERFQIAHNIRLIERVWKDVYELDKQLNFGESSGVVPEVPICIR